MDENEQQRIIGVSQKIAIHAKDNDSVRFGILTLQFDRETFLYRLLLDDHLVLEYATLAILISQILIKDNLNDRGLAAVRDGDTYQLEGYIQPDMVIDLVVRLGHRLSVIYD